VILAFPSATAVPDAPLVKYTFGFSDENCASKALANSGLLKLTSKSTTLVEELDIV
jgi:hypothetical protein